MAIKAKLKTKSPCEIALDTTVERADLDAAYERTFKQLSRYIELPGFRTGKAPRPLVESKFKKHIQHNTLEDLIAGVVRSVVKKHNMVPVTSPRMAAEPEFPAEGPLAFEVEFEVAPSFELKPYKGVALQTKKAKVSEEDVNRMIESLREQHATFEEPTEDRTAMFGDWLIVDYVAEVEGQQVMKRDDAWVEVSANSKMPVPGFGEQLAGLKRGQVHMADVTAPADYHNKELAGKKLAFTATVKKIQERCLPPMTDELAGKIDPSCPTVAALRDAIKKNQEQYRDMEDQRRLRTLAREALVRDNPLPLPPSRVASYARRVLEQEVRQRMKQGQTEQQVKDAMTELHKAAAISAEFQLRSEYILDAIAKAEKIEVTDDDIKPQLEYYAQAFRRSVEWVRHMFEREGHLDAVYESARETKALDIVVAQAAVKD